MEMVPCSFVFESRSTKQFENDNANRVSFVLPSLQSLLSYILILCSAKHGRGSGFAGRARGSEAPVPKIAGLQEHRLAALHFGTLVALPSMGMLS